MDVARSVPLGHVADLNPRLLRKLSDSTAISFVPMAAMSAEEAKVTLATDRPYADVRKGYTYFENGDVLVAKITPCFENGKIAQAVLPRQYGFGSTEFHVVRPILGTLDGRYLHQFLRQARIRFEGERRMTGSGGQRRVPEDFLAQLAIPLPPLLEQRRIAAILARADAIRAMRREALAQLDSLTQSIFIEMFGDPVVNPKDWELMSFGSVGKLDRGVSKARPRNTPELLGGPYPLIQTGDVANCDGYVRTHTATYSEAGLRQSKLWPAGTLCITIAANIAKTGVLMFDACFPDSVVGFRAAQVATVEYARVWLSFLQKALEDAAPESAQKNINLAILRDLKMPVPPLALQQTFATRIQSIESLKATHRAALAESDALFASLQHRAFAGQLS